MLQLCMLLIVVFDDASMDKEKTRKLQGYKNKSFKQGVRNTGKSQKTRKDFGGCIYTSLLTLKPT